jgi:flagellar motor switch protein FliG
MGVDREVRQVDRFEIVGSRKDKKNLVVYVSYRDTARELKALNAVLDELAGRLEVKYSALGSDDSQRHAFIKVLSQMLQFADEGNFGPGITEVERHKRLRALTSSVNDEMTALTQEHRHRKVMAVSYNKPEDPAALFKAVQKRMAKAV